MKYKVVDTLEDLIRIAEKQENIKSTPIPPQNKTNIHYTSLRVSSSTSTLHPSNTLSSMEAVIEQLVSQMTQINVHFLEPRAFRNTE